MIDDKCIFNFGIFFWSIGDIDEYVFNISDIIIKYFKIVYLNGFYFDGFCFMYVVVGYKRVKYSRFDNN